MPLPSSPINSGAASSDGKRSSKATQFEPLSKEAYLAYKQRCKQWQQEKLLKASVAANNEQPAERTETEKVSAELDSTKSTGNPSGPKPKIFFLTTPTPSPCSS
jgi:hypothetical protein